MTALLMVFVLAQLVLGLRVAARMIATTGGERIPSSATPPRGAVAVVVPVLNEAARLGPCMDALSAQGAEVRDILVVDGGSSDDTAAIVARAAERDPRVRWIVAGAPAAGWTGKSWNLATALDAVAADVEWVLTIDADVRPAPGLARALATFAEDRGLPALSVATRQRVRGFAAAIVHPACLATLVYRFGIPGHATRDVAHVQANGQCFLARRHDLVGTRAVDEARASLCEDVTIARVLAAAGRPVGFYEAPGLVDVEMYPSARETWRNWPRSLAMRDHLFEVRGWLGLAEVALAQALPLPALVAGALLGAPGWLLVPNAALAVMRVGVSAGTARAYEARPWTYWLSPLADLPVAWRVITSALRRGHRWRGLEYRRDGVGRFTVVTSPSGGSS